MHDFPSEFPSLLDALEYHANACGDKTVLRRLGFRGKPHDEMTFAQLRKRAQAFAKSLIMVTAPHDRILLAYPSSNAFVVAFLGCLYAGRIAVPVSLGSNVRSGQRIDIIARDCGAAALVSTDITAKGLIGATDSGCLALDHATLESGAAQTTLAPCVASDICFLQYTSGSTGQPKGVIVTHENLVANLTQILHAIGPDRTRIVSWLPQFHDMGLIGTMLLPVYAAVESTYMAPLEFVQRPIRWLQAMSDYQAHGSVAPNFGFSYVLERLKPGDLDGIDLSNVGSLMCGSEPINHAVLDDFVTTLHPCGLDPCAPMPTYGLAEATLMVSAHPRNTGLRAQTPPDAADLQNQTVVSCGGAAMGLTVKIIAPDGVECDDGVEGEIVISGPNVCRGYWGKAPHSGALPTGDLGFMSRNDLFVTGRKKDLIILRGRNFHPTDIEALSEACTPNGGVNSSVAVGVTDQNGVEQLIVAQEIPSSFMRQLDPSALRTKISETILNTFNIAPAEVLLLRSNSVPRTTSGKISRSGFKTALAAQNVTEAFPKLPQG